jgi:Ca-activated chloride channel homolog
MDSSLQSLETFRFLHPHFLWLLVLVPLLGLLRGGRSKPPVVKWPSLHLLEGLGSVPSHTLGGWRPLWMMLPLTAAIFALARPQKVRQDELIEDSGIEIMISLDVSLSMSIEDFFIDRDKVNRLTVAKNVIRDFAKGRRSDRIGLMAFAGRPYLASPLTMDQEWFGDSLKRVDFNQVEDGTAIGSAIAASVSRLDKRKEAKSKIVLLLTDGANNSGSITPVGAAELAKSLGIRVYTIAIGTPGRHLVPLSTRSGQQPGYLMQFDEASLEEVAKIANGRFYKGQDTEAVRKIFSDIDQLERTKLKVKSKLLIRELFPIPLVAALLLAIVGLLGFHLFSRTFPS